MRIISTLQVFDDKVGGILKNHEEGFLYAYKEQMQHIQKELKNLKSKVGVQKANTKLKFSWMRKH